MRKLNFQKDQQFYNTEQKAPDEYEEDLLDSYRFGLLRKHLSRDGFFLNRTVLNVAGGYGREAYLILSLLPKLLLLGDYSFQQILQARRYLGKFNNKTFLCFDGEKLPFKDKVVDVGYIAEALHHFINPKNGIEELIRVSRFAVVIDEPAQGLIRGVLNRIFVALRLKEEYERGYLEAFRINRQILEKYCLKYNMTLFCYPYFIYYFKWYKKCKMRLLKLTYKNFLQIFNALFHPFGNRVIAVMSFNVKR
jgi:ubiquinone/menaquinone biosynthesis C-methylase UbiE